MQVLCNLCSPSWLVDSKRIATKIKSASGFSDAGGVKWKSNPTRACPSCQHVIDNSDVRFLMSPNPTDGFIAHKNESFCFTYVFFGKIQFIFYLIVDIIINIKHAKGTSTCFLAFVCWDMLLDVVSFVFNME